MPKILTKTRLIALVKFSNLFLLAINALAGIYLLFMPLVPEISYWARVLGRDWNLNINIFPENTFSRLENSDYNQLRIEKIGVAGEVHTSADTDTLDKGIWHKSSTGNPEQGGNMVILAHRFLYLSGPNTFYHLDKLRVGETIELEWEGKNYIYKIDEVKVVPATATEIESQSSEHKLTLYTCTPLWTSKNRLVVTAYPEEVQL